MPDPKTRDNIGPRLDYALTKTNTSTSAINIIGTKKITKASADSCLPSAGFDTATTEKTLQMGDTQIFGTKVVNETRFQWLREANTQTPQSTLPKSWCRCRSRAAATAAGNQVDTANHFEFQNYTSIQFTKHFLKFGARLRGMTDGQLFDGGFNSSYLFPSIRAYQQTIEAGTPSASQFSRDRQFRQITTSAEPVYECRQVDVGLYVEDDWRIKPNITLSYGLRFESQNNISDHADLAPRLGFAWGIGGGGIGAEDRAARRFRRSRTQ